MVYERMILVGEQVRYSERENAKFRYPCFKERMKCVLKLLRTSSITPSLSKNIYLGAEAIPCLSECHSPFEALSTPSLPYIHCLNNC